LLGACLLEPDELEEALRRQAERGQRLGETLLEMGVLTEEQLLPFVEQHLGVDGIRLREGLLDPQAVQRIPQALATRLNALALFCVRGVLTVAMADPQDLEVIDEIEQATGLDVRPVFAFAGSLAKMIERGYQDDFEVETVTADLSDGAVELQALATEVDTTSVEQLVEGSPVINLVNYLILQAVRKGASDIHIEPGRKFSVVRFRIDGQLVEMLRPRRDIYPAVVSRVKVMSKLDIAEQRAPQDGRCQVVVDKKEVDLRVSTLPTVLGEKVVMRVLDKQRLTFNLDELGIPQDVLTPFKKLLARPNGLLLVTGPTGSGKTTTLYSALELIKSVHRNIVTVEDPVEYQIELVNQVQIDQSRKVGFAGALRSILRQDPDVIMVGEIRDPETAQVAVQAALTGHLVLSTLHTNDAAGAVTRMTDMGVEPYKLSAALQGVVAQRLVRTICPKCRTSYFPSREYLKALYYEGDGRRSFAKGEGCRDCFDTGFQGRIGIYEVLAGHPSLRRMIADGVDLDEIRQWSREQGNRSLLQSGLALAEQEKTSLEEVARVALFD
ncbi:MAG: Flp pilus assembly complex ATPase component TadA, partial [Planctomycetales bacterium]|nr:Flp pilus assembly complex ATPase component TadA [Planctomycetales bacterium]